MVLVRLIKLLVVLIVLADLFLLARPLPLLTLSILNRRPACPLSQVFKIIAEDRHYYQARDRILKASRLTSDDPACFHLWDTPRDTIWAPADSDRLIATLLAEQELKIYGTGPTARTFQGFSGQFSVLDFSQGPERPILEAAGNGLNWKPDWNHPARGGLVDARTYPGAHKWKSWFQPPQKDVC